jgi:hypothetical protein
MPTLTDLALPLQVSNGQLVFRVDGNAVAQRLANRVLTFRNEWFLDANTGTPYYEQILGAVPDEQAAASVFRSVVQADPAVLAVPVCVVTYSLETRLFSVRIEATISLPGDGTAGDTGSVLITVGGLPDGAIVIDGLALVVGGVPVVVSL